MTPRLEFFKATILEPALAYREAAGSQAQLITNANLGAVEAAHWASLGAQIGYFDEAEVFELISSAQQISRSWSELRNQQVISSHEEWANIMHSGRDGTATLNREIFASAQHYAPVRDSVQNAWQTLLMVNAEHVLDDSTYYFLASIAWTEDAQWTALKQGESGTAVTITEGFGNVLTYWQELYSLNKTLQTQPEGPGIRSFLEAIRKISSRRFSLSRKEIRYRYVQLLSELISHAEDGSPEWQDAQSRMTQELEGLLANLEGKAAIESQARPHEIAPKHDSPIGADPKPEFVTFDKLTRRLQPSSRPLTIRELETLQMIGRGLSDRDIALGLGISVATVKKHVATLLQKTGTRTRIQLARMVMEHLMRHDPLKNK